MAILSVASVRSGFVFGLSVRRKGVIQSVEKTTGTIQTAGRQEENSIKRDYHQKII